MAFVLSSGASLGAVQVGVLRALLEHGVRPDLIVGCSIGAVNGAAVACEPTAAGIAHLEQLWTATDLREVFGRSRWAPTLGLVRRREGVHSAAPFRRLLERALPRSTFAELSVPLHCLATDVHAGTEAWFHDGPLIEALLASTAMPAMFPPVDIGGRRYLDGAVVNDVPVRRAAELGARRIYVVAVGPLARKWKGRTRPLGTAVEAYWLARRHRFRQELHALPRDVEVHLMPDGEPPRLRLTDLSRSADLITAGHRAASDHLRSLARIDTTPFADHSEHRGTLRT
ncbi:MAG: patatin-like phospholipase family protein [Acidimicrobiia bacterium]